MFHKMTWLIGQHLCHGWTLTSFLLSLIPLFIGEYSNSLMNPLFNFKRTYCRPCTLFNYVVPRAMVSSTAFFSNVR